MLFFCYETKNILSKLVITGILFKSLFLLDEKMLKQPIISNATYYFWQFR